jgi:hypothetical protein
MRGFSHLTTARLLVPRMMRDKFDEDPERYVQCVLYINESNIYAFELLRGRSGRRNRNYTGRLPVVFVSAGRVQPKGRREGAFEEPFPCCSMYLAFSDESIRADISNIQCMRYLYTGPASAANKDPGPHGKGRPCIAVANGARRVEPEMIAWTAVMVSVLCYVFYS